LDAVAVDMTRYPPEFAYQRVVVKVGVWAGGLPK